MAILRMWVLGRRLTLVCNSHDCVCLLDAVGLSEGYLSPPLDSSEKDSKDLQTCLERRELKVVGRDC